MGTGAEVAAPEAAKGAAEVAGAAEGADAIETMISLTEAAGTTATPAAAAAGYGSMEAYLGSINPGWLSGAGIGTAIASSKVGTTVLGQAAGSAAASLVGKTGVPAVRPAPTLGPTPIMPLQDEQAVANARKKAAAMQATNSGRASTILTDQSQKLGN